MPDSQRLESLLIADIGSGMTKVGLVDRVGGDFRFVSAGVSASTAEPPNSDVVVGLRRAIDLIQARTGRRFLSDDGQLITPDRGTGQGVDAFAVTTSAPSPLRVAIVGVSREVSLATAIRAIHGTYATLEATLALDQTGGRWLPAPAADDDGADGSPKSFTAARDPAVIAAQDLARANPEVILIVGGIDGGATTPVYEIANLVAAIVASGDESARPTILFAGNRDARSQVAARIGNVAPFRAVDNVRPSLDDENLSPLQRELEALYIERKITWLPGLNALSAWTPAAILPTARAFENVVRFIARRYNLNVLGADLGAASTTVITSRSSGFSRVVRADLGVGRNLENVLALGGSDRLMRWLPMEMDPKAAELHWLNHTLHPLEIPMTREDARLMDAAGRVALAVTVEESAVDLRGIDLILLTGRVFAHNSNPGSLALLALDALQPSGVFTLAVDTLGLAPAFGALASLQSTAAAGTLERDGFVTLGTVIAPISNLREGQVDLRVKIQSETTGTLNLEVRHGSLELVPLPAGKKASIEVYPSRGVDLGNKPGGVFRAQVEGGSIGVVIDARGRPIALPADVEKARAQVQKWYWDIGGEVSYG